MNLNTNLPPGTIAGDIDRNAGSDNTVCERCDGYGYIWVPDPDNFEDDIQTKCPICHGTGEVTE